MESLKIQEKAIEKIVGKAIPKPSNDQNTDDIVPARYLKEITFAKMGNYAYFDERFKDGKEVKEHVFNQPAHKGAKVLIAGANYGCGSSREHAPQALKRFGIDAIIAESFAEIFAGNCASLGIVGVTVPAKEIAELAEIAELKPETIFEVDLSSKIVKAGDKTVGFEILEGRRQAFLNGTWDAMAILQHNQAGIQATAAKIPYLKMK